MKLNKALQVMSRRYRYLKRCKDVDAKEESEAIRSLVAHALVNKELGTLPDQILRMQAKELLKEHSFLYENKEGWYIKPTKEDV